MQSIRLLLCLGVTSLACAAFAGCGPTPRSEIKPPPAADEHDHDHAHEALGPHEGHLLVLKKDEYQAEWVHDDATGTVTVYLLDGKAKEAVQIPASKLEIITSLGEKTKTYELAATDASGEPAKASTFETTDRSLLEALKAVGHGVTAKLTVPIDDQPLEAEFEHMEHDHGHHH